MSLHLFRGGEAQDMDAGLQDVLCQADEGDMTGFQFFVLFLQDGSFMVELVDAACKLVDIGTDHVGSGRFQGSFQAGAELGDSQHQILGLGIGRILDG